MEILTHAAIRMNPDDIRLSDRSQTHKDTQVSDANYMENLEQ